MANILKNKWVEGGLVVVVLLGVWYWWPSGSGTPALTSSADVQTPVSQELLATLASLHTITLNNAIFSDPAFTSLTDFGVTIAPQPTGRRNPFAPVGQ